jgi:hypothetical protein
MPEGRRFGWVLNLDAELELGRPNYTRSAKLSAQLARYTDGVRGLFGPEDIAIEGRPPAFGDYVGRAWCPTPHALRIMKQQGVEPEPHADVNVVRAANHRRFSFELGGGPPSSVYVEDRAALQRVLEGSSRNWLIKRPLGFAGRGQLYVRGPLTSVQSSWVDVSLRTNGLLIEPLVELRGEFALHGYIERSGSFRLGRACVQDVGPRGVWKLSRIAGPAELEADESAALLCRGESVADALVRLGYFGPFGIDAYRYLDEGEPRFCSLSEINARFTMGFAVGFPVPAWQLYP